MSLAAILRPHHIVIVEQGGWSRSCSVEKKPGQGPALTPQVQTIDADDEATGMRVKRVNPFGWLIIGRCTVYKRGQLPRAFAICVKMTCEAFLTQ